VRPAAATPLRILIVEDERELGQVLAEIGHRPEVVGSAEAAVGSHSAVGHAAAASDHGARRSRHRPPSRSVRPGCARVSIACSDRGSPHGWPSRCRMGAVGGCAVAGRQVGRRAHGGVLVPGSYAGEIARLLARAQAARCTAQAALPPSPRNVARRAKICKPIGADLLTPRPLKEAHLIIAPPFSDGAVLPVSDTTITTATILLTYPGVKLSTASQCHRFKRRDGPIHADPAPDSRNGAAMPGRGERLGGHVGGPHVINRG
jgi:hypothetical protein